MTTADFDRMIAAHVRWRVRFAQFAQGRPDDRLSGLPPERDDLCELGRWLYGEGVVFSHLRCYRNLLKWHAQFHVYAGEIARLGERGELTPEHIGLGSRFIDASLETIAALTALKGEVALSVREQADDEMELPHLLLAAR